MPTYRQSIVEFHDIALTRQSLPPVGYEPTADSLAAFELHSLVQLERRDVR